MAVWNEAIYYFHLAPQDFRKILFVLHDRREQQGESLLWEDTSSACASSIVFARRPPKLNRPIAL
jgi:hypothetical protein